MSSCVAHTLHCLSSFSESHSIFPVYFRPAACSEALPDRCRPGLWQLPPSQLASSRTHSWILFWGAKWGRQRCESSQTGIVKVSGGREKVKANFSYKPTDVRHVEETGPLDNGLHFSWVWASNVLSHSSLGHITPSDPQTRQRGQLCLKQLRSWVLTHVGKWELLRQLAGLGGPHARQSWDSKEGYWGDPGGGLGGGSELSSKPGHQRCWRESWSRALAFPHWVYLPFHIL